MAAERIVIVGNGRMTQACAAILRDRMPQRLRLIVAESRPGPAQSRLASFCEKSGIPIAFHDRPINDSQTVSRMSAERPDLILSIDNFQIFGATLLRLPALGCVNFHNGLLDRYRGVNAPSWALFNGETEHGVSWHTMEPDVDAGMVLATARFPLDDTQTALTLTLECVRAGIELFDAHLERLLAPDHGERADISQARLYTRKDLPNGGFLDPLWPRAKIDRMLRATDFRPYPNPFTYSKLRVGTTDLIVNAARVVADRPTAAAGSLVADAESRLLLSCADADLELTDVMLEPDQEASVDQAIEALGLVPGRRISLPQ